MLRIFAGVGVLLSLAAPSAAQSRVITGIVNEEFTGRPVPNAEVIVVGEQGGACTNARGEYRLEVPVGSVSLVARTSELLSRPTTLTATQTTATLGIHPQVQWPTSTNPGWFFATLVHAPEIEVVRGKLFFEGRELPNPAATRCHPTGPERGGGVEDGPG